MFKSHRATAGIFIMLALPVVFWALSALAAGSADKAPSVTVQYHDLNLESPQDVVRLYARIHAAAATVCKLAEDSRSVDRAFWNKSDACVDHAVAKAVMAVHNDKLSTYHWTQIRGWKHWSDEGTATRVGAGTERSGN